MTGAQVVATARSTAHGVETFALRDNGLAPDDRANDGIYSGSFSDTVKGGPFAIEALARWTGADGVSRERIFTTGVSLASLDSDGDTIPDEPEDQQGGIPDPLDPNDPTDAGEDPDRDGLVNWKEWEIGLDPLDFDTDDGGASDGLEVCLRLDPESPDDDHKAFVDTDNDGLPDRWEGIFGPEAGDPAADPDGDGLTNAEELRWCTNPLDPDTDGDGEDDGDEVDQGLDPTDLYNRSPPAGPHDCPKRCSRHDDCCCHGCKGDGCYDHDCRCHDRDEPEGIPPQPCDGDDGHGKKPTGKDKYAVSFHLGYPFPLFDFDHRGAEGEVSGEVDFEWRFGPQRSLELVLGSYPFDLGLDPRSDPLWTDTDIDGLSAYYKAYLAPAGVHRVFWHVGPGTFDVQRGLSTFGVSGGVGWQAKVAPHLEAEVAGTLFHLFSRNAQDAIDFLLTKVGFKVTF